MDVMDDTGRVLKLSCHLLTCSHGHAVVVMINNISTEERAEKISEWLHDVLLTAMDKTSPPFKPTMFH